MPEANEQELGLYVLACLLVAFFLVVFVFGFAIFLKDFCSEMRFINREIARTKGAERRHYVRRRKRLWLSLLPFIEY